MKKLFLLLSIISIVFSSCSSDDSVNSNEQLTSNGYLLKKSTYTDNSGNVTTYEYFYDGNKITNVDDSNGTVYEYTYTGNLITQFKFYVNNVLNMTENYAYNADEKITQRKIYLYSNNTCRRGEFIYNFDGTVSVNTYTGDFSVQNDLASERKVFFLPNGDVEKMEKYVTVNGVNHIRTSTYNYDSMNSTSNTIIGMNKIKKWDDGSNPSNAHNVIAEISTTTESSSVTTVNFNFTYNSYNFPVTSNFMFGSSLIGTSQYFYLQP